GMIASLREELTDALKSSPATKGKRTVTLITGAAVHSTMCSIAEEITKKYPDIKINVEKIINNFFGEQITVSGLLTGKDIYEQLCSEDLGDALILPCNCLRSEGDLFLCGMSHEELSEKLGVPISFSSDEGQSCVSKIFGVEV
ncbi:MAG: DUF512 domain-containing protein, partial [Clostridia bacterium]|nr:DUF512 domain-containing protein [Clostridia bacterium]